MVLFVAVATAFFVGLGCGAFAGDRSGTRDGAYAARLGAELDWVDALNGRWVGWTVDRASRRGPHPSTTTTGSTGSAP